MMIKRIRGIVVFVCPGIMELRMRNVVTPNVSDKPSPQSGPAIFE
jgi:hypothetical protein